MLKRNRALISYCLILVIIITTFIHGNEVAAEIWESGFEITESTDSISITTDGDGNTVYSLLSNYTGDLSINLQNGETAILDGNGYKLKGLDNKNGLSVNGSGDLYIENITIEGGKNSNGMNIGEDVYVILTGTADINISGGAVSGLNTSLQARTGQVGVDVRGSLLFANEGNVNISGSDGVIADQNTDNGYYCNGGDGGAAIRHGGNIIANDFSKISLTGGTAGTNYDPEGIGMGPRDDGASIEFNWGWFIPTSVFDSDYSIDILNSGNEDFDFEIVNKTDENTIISTDDYRLKVPRYDLSRDFLGQLPISLKKGYSFLGWYSDAALTEEMTSISGIGYTTTVYAKYSADNYDVTFNSNGGSIVPNQLIEYNKKASEPEIPTRKNYRFDGWYSDDDLTVSYDFNTAVKGDVTLYAKWTPLYRVVLTSRTYMITPNQTVAEGDVVVQPSGLKKTGHHLIGWYSDYEGTTPYSFDTPLTGNIRIYAKWAPDVYTVTFNSKGGSAVKAQNVTYKKYAAVPEYPTRSNCVFGGWYTDNNTFTHKFNFKLVLRNDVTLFAKWYKVTLSNTSLALAPGKSSTNVKATAINGDSIVKWTSSNTKVAKVSSTGKVTGVKAGTATITVKSKMGAKATFKVTVK